MPQNDTTAGTSWSGRRNWSGSGGGSGGWEAKQAVDRGKKRCGEEGAEERKAHHFAECNEHNSKIHSRTKSVTSSPRSVR
mmetsp:Transcript_115940/g.328107  ORF Transcript_115940/g.328107 Transcript_115940/m.328107 type:complete len:80 (+) Transcript_115940:3-242(+)